MTCRATRPSLPSSSRRFAAASISQATASPSEAVLCERFDASRITVAKAIQTLQGQGLVNRRAGSGTYVQLPPSSTSLQFGLLIPELGRTEIFEPICQGIISSPLSKSHSLIWGHSAEAGEDDREAAAEQLCQQYIEQKVAGVFFAPLEFTRSRDKANRRIIAALQHADMPVVLLDRCYEIYPRRSLYDLVGIDNHRAGHSLTLHLQEHGARRIVFVTRPNHASTVDERIAGYFEAIRDAAGYPGHVARLDGNDTEAVRQLMETEAPDAIVCANDLTAASLMHTLERLRVTIPQQVRLVGVDDVSYAKFLPVPLTTIRQDCAEIGSVAMALMLDRIQRPHRAPRDVLIHFDLIVRESCGHHAPAVPCLPR